MMHTPSTPSDHRQSSDTAVVRALPAPRENDGASLRTGSAFASFRSARHFPLLDGLRGLSIVAVLWHHSADPDGPWGFLGVSLFFAISGLLITTLLLRERESTGRIDLGAFYARRTLRIFPLYYAVVGLYVLAVLALDRHSAEGRQFFANLPYFATYTSNLFVDLGTGTRTIFYFAWSLATEEQFYLLWPATVRSLPGWRRPASLMLVVVVVAVAGYSLMDAATPSHPGLLTALASTTTIGLGCLAAYALHEQGSFRYLFPLLGRRWALPALLILVPYAGIARAPLALSAVLLVSLVVASCIRPASPGELLGHPALREIGKISYGMYLFHMLCLNVVRRLLPVTLQRITPVLFLCTLALTVIVAEISFRTYERWFLRFKDRFRPKGLPDATRASEIVRAPAA
jgi:peptidoglycan/LPS O-acetylase OafA/YrhL